MTNANHYNLNDMFIRLAPEVSASVALVEIQKVFKSMLIALLYCFNITVISTANLIMIIFY